MTIKMNGCKNLNCIGKPGDKCYLTPGSRRGYRNGNGPHPDGCGGKVEKAGPGCPARPGATAAEAAARLTTAFKGWPPASILQEAVRIRSGERNADYGDAVESFEIVAEIANAITGLNLTPAQCCKVLLAVKLTRERYNHKRDNLVDLCGYADILNLIEDSII